MSALKVEVLKNKITPLETSLKVSRGKLERLNADFGKPELVDAQSVLDKGKAQVNQLAILMLLQNKRILNPAKGKQLREQLRSVWGDVTQHKLVEYIMDDVTKEVDEVPGRGLGSA
jgi:hypothetical protein